VARVAPVAKGRVRPPYIDIYQMPTTDRLGTDFGFRVDDFRWQACRRSLVAAVFTNGYGQPELTVKHKRHRPYGRRNDQLQSALRSAPTRLDTYAVQCGFCSITPNQPMPL
jgi:hypothetical protein